MLNPSESAMSIMAHANPIAGAARMTRLIIARFDKARAEDDNEIEFHCRSAVAMFIAAHGGNDQERG
jgi:hypothetical protein